MDDQAQQNETRKDLFSDVLISELQSHFKTQFGRELNKAEAQDTLLKIAELVFRKEKKKADAIPTI